MNWKEILASIASDKGQDDLSKHILKYVEETKPVYEILSSEPIDIKHDYSTMSTKMFTITRMPEATCDGCQ